MRPAEELDRARALRSHRQQAEWWGHLAFCRLQHLLHGRTDPPTLEEIAEAAMEAARHAHLVQASRKRPASRTYLAKWADKARVRREERERDRAWTLDYLHDQALRENRERTRRALLDFDLIRAWRQTEDEAGRPSGLDDYFESQGICPECKGTGCADCDDTGGTFR